MIISDRALVSFIASIFNQVPWREFRCEACRTEGEQLDAERLVPRNQKGCYRPRYQRRSLRRYQRRYHSDTNDAISDDISDDISEDISADITDEISDDFSADVRDAISADVSDDTNADVRDDVTDDVTDATIDVVIDDGGTGRGPRAGMDKAPYYLPIGRRRPREIEEFLFYEG